MKDGHNLTQKFRARIHGERLMRELLRPRQGSKKSTPHCDTEKALRLLRTADLSVRSNEIRETPRALAEKKGLPVTYIHGDGDAGDTMLTAALRNKHTDIRKEIQPLVDPNETNNRGEHPIIVALETRCEQEVVDLIRDPRMKLDDVTDEIGHNLPTLISAAQMHDAMDALHTRGVDLHTVSQVHMKGTPTGQSDALHWAVFNLDMPMVLKIAPTAPQGQLRDALDHIAEMREHKSALPEFAPVLAKMEQVLHGFQHKQKKTAPRRGMTQQNP